jgi:1,4-alpha-glucan branching enzyme
MNPKSPHRTTVSANARPKSVPETRNVDFSFHDPKASAIAIAGSFNDWHPSATPMVALGDGRWSKTLHLPAGTYEYLFVVDGRWVADPGSAITVSNPFGGINCCVNVR